MSEPIKFDMFGNRCFSLNLDMHLYKPEEIKVSYKAATKMVCIEATCEEKFDPKSTSMSESSWLCNSKGSCKRTYIREFALPEECKIENLKCHLSFNGWLCFECVMPSMTSSTCPTTTMSNMSSMSCPWFMPNKGFKSISNRFDAIPLTVTVKTA